MGKKKIKLADIEEKYSYMEYDELYEYILSEIEKKKLIPVNASGINGKKPALYNAYWVTEKERDYSEVKEELMYKISPMINTEYYLKRPEKYEADRKDICLLSDYLIKHREALRYSETINERSFEIFHREKFLARDGGMGLLKRLDMSGSALNFYMASEPMSYYSHQKNHPQNFLIIENKDTFYSMRHHMINGADMILGLQFGTLIYGGGKGIHKSFEDYVNVVEPYFADTGNKVYYFGDLDYEGILIYESLAEKYKDKVEIYLFTNAYERMLKKAEYIGFSEMPFTKEGQNHNIGQCFLEQFSNKVQKDIKRILQEERYIPQEILNAGDY